MLDDAILFTAGTLERSRILGLAAVLLAISAAMPIAAEPVGLPLGVRGEINLGPDLGSGKAYRASLEDDFQPWGAMVVSTGEGHPARLGEKSIRFETREGFCGHDGPFWDDCANGRNRHELSTSSDPDLWKKDNWYALSLYLPASFDPPRQVGTSLFQFWAGGLDSWMLRYWKEQGLLIDRKLDNDRAVIVPAGEGVDRWTDFILRVRHSIDQSGSFTLWANGERVYHYIGRTAAGADPGRLPYLKFGIYSTALGADGQPVGSKGFSDGEGLPNLHLYFDEVRYGRTCADLELAELGYDCANLTSDGADREQVARLQSALNALGCNVGTADGVIGPRTLAAALGCRYFADARLPDELTAANLEVFIDIYTDPRVAAFPKAPPDDRVRIASVSSQLVGGNNDHALNIDAEAQGLRLNLIVIGRFDQTGATNWLDMLLEDDLGDIPAALRRCPGLRTETWGDGSTHAVIQFTRRGTGYLASGAECILPALPPEVAPKALYLLDNFQKVAGEISARHAKAVSHPEINTFLERAAAGEFAVSR